MEIGITMVNKSDEKKMKIKSIGMNFHYIESYSLFDQLKNLDALILHVQSKEDIQKIYRLILSIKSETDIPMWIVAEQITDFDRFIFLQLGILGTIDKAVIEDELVLVVTNTLKYFKQDIGRITNLESNQKLDSKLRIIDKNLSIGLADGTEIVLTKTEYKLITLLADTPNETVSYKNLVENIWVGFEESNQYYRVANIVFHLRKKFKQHSLNPEIIKTVRSRGYMLCI